MAYRLFRRGYFKDMIYFSLLWTFLIFQSSSSLFANACIFIDEEDTQRTKTATIVAGATLVALVGGVAYAAFGSDHRGHHSSHHHSSSRHDSSSYSDYSDYSDFSPIYDESYSGSSSSYRHHKHRRHRRHSRSSSSSSFGSGSESLSERLGPQLSPPFPRDRDLPLRARQLLCSQNAKEAHQLSGIFISHPILSKSGESGSFTAFVRLPDGTTQVLGHLPFSAHKSSSLSYGPFKQKGSYTFGISLDEGTLLPRQAKVGSVEISINGSLVQSGDFQVPAQSLANFEPQPYDYDFQ